MHKISVKQLGCNAKRILLPPVFTMIVFLCGFDIAAQTEFNPEDYIEGGEEALYYYMLGQHISYPESSIERAAFGLSIAELVLNAKGNILEVNIVNSVDKDIDQQVINLVNGTKDLWKKNGKDTTRLYFQFRYRMFTDNYQQGNYQFIANERFLSPFFITEVDFENNAVNLVSDDSLALWSSAAIRQHDYILANQYLDELIRRNPYTFQFYQLRISVNSKLQNTAKVNDDLKKMSEFVLGLPFNQVITADYNELNGISNESDSGRAYMIVATMPEYPGGEPGLYEYIGTNIKYPYEARVNGIQGRVYVSFTVDTDGYAKDTQVIRGIGGGCDEEAVRLIENMARWTPGLVSNGNPVKVRYNLPIKFSLGL
jgi:TonB family protein